jgi:hypothetical protein
MIQTFFQLRKRLNEQRIQTKLVDRCERTHQGLDERKQAEQTGRAHALLDRHGSNHFVAQLIAENFGRLPEEKTAYSGRMSLSKKGGNIGNLHALGGKLEGVLVRELKPESFQAWLHAESVGIPVEPILKRKDGKPRAAKIKRDGIELIRVVTRYCGPTAYDHLRKNPDDLDEIRKQMDKIHDGLRTHQINYPGNDAGHLLDPDDETDYRSDNFTVEHVAGKPMVRLIDWDKARLGKMDLS